MVGVMTASAADYLKEPFPESGVSFMTKAPDGREGRGFLLDANQLAGCRVKFSCLCESKLGLPSQRWQGGKFMVTYKHNGLTDYPGYLFPTTPFAEREISVTVEFEHDTTWANVHFGINHAQGSVRFRNLEIKVLGRLADLRPVANAPLPDGLFKPAPRSCFANVPFTIVKPEVPGGNAVLGINAGKTSEVELKDLAGKRLWLLHRFGGGKMKVTGEKGSREIEVAPGKMVGYAWRGKGDKPQYLYVSGFDVSDLGAIDTVAFTAGKDPWEIFGITVSDEDFKPVENPEIVHEGEVWKRPPKSAPARIVPGSVLDLTDVLPMEPAERVVIRGGRFVRASDGKPMHFLSDAHCFFRRVTGFWSHKPEFDSDERIREFVLEMKRRGFNMFRLHFTDASFMVDSKNDYEMNPKMVDAFHRLVKYMNEYGVYLNLDVMASGLGWYAGYAWGEPAPGQKVVGKRGIYLNAEARENWRRGCEMLFSMKNPYTGRQLKDEPCLVCAVAYNEQEFGFSVPGKKGYADCTEQFRKWLKLRYKKIEALNAVRKSSYSSFDEVPVFTANDVSHAITPSGYDAMCFMDDMQVSLTKKYNTWFRTYAPDRAISNWNMAKDLRQMSLRKYCDYVSINGYHAHPFGDRFRHGNGDYQEPSSCISMSALLARSFAACRLQGKPMLVTEYSIGWWNRYRYEMGFVMGGYAALQGWDGLTPFSENATITTDPAPVSTFEHWRDPVLLSGNLITALAFRRGDVAPSGLNIRLTIDRRKLLDSRNSQFALSDPQCELALIGSLALAVDEPADRGSFERQAQSGAAIIFQTAGFQTSEKDTAETGGDLVAALRAERRIGTDNATDAAKRVFESSTGELLLDAKESFMRVNTPRMQGVCSQGGAYSELPDVKILKMSRRGNLVVMARDGLKSIRESNRLLVAYVTDASNEGMAFANEGSRLLSMGTLPVLLATGEFQVAVRTEHAKTLKAWAVAVDGSRIAEIPLTRGANAVKLCVDTAELSCGPVFYFELAEK